MKNPRMVLVPVAAVVAAASLGIAVLGQEREEVPPFDYRNEKSILISLASEDDELTLSETSVLFAPSPGHFNQYDELGLTVVLFDRDGESIEQFQIWNPLLGLEEDSDDKDEMEGRIIELKDVKVDLVVPFRASMTTVALFKPGVEPTLPNAMLEVDLTDAIAEHCERYADDPLCKVD